MAGSTNAALPGSVQDPEGVRASVLATGATAYMLGRNDEGFRFLVGQRMDRC